jgi:hypothetical protein
MWKKNVLTLIAGCRIWRLRRRAVEPWWSFWRWLGRGRRTGSRLKGVNDKEKDKKKRSNKCSNFLLFVFFIYFCWKIEKKKRQGYWRKMDGRSRTYCGWLKRSRWPRSVADNGGWRWLVSPWNTIFHEDYRSTLIPKKRKRKNRWHTMSSFLFYSSRSVVMCFYFYFLYLCV